MNYRTSSFKIEANTSIYMYSQYSAISIKVVKTKLKDEREEGLQDCSKFKLRRSCSLELVLNRRISKWPGFYEIIFAYLEDKTVHTINRLAT